MSSPEIADFAWVPINIGRPRPREIIIFGFPRATNIFFWRFSPYVSRFHMIFLCPKSDKKSASTSFLFLNGGFKLFKGGFPPSLAFCTVVGSYFLDLCSVGRGGDLTEQTRSLRATERGVPYLGVVLGEGYLNIGFHSDIHTKFSGSFPAR